MPFGLRGSTSFSADERPKNWRMEILFSMPNSAPLTALINKVPSEVTKDPEFKWFTKGLQVQTTTVNGAQTAGDTAIEVLAGSGQKFKGGHVVMNGRTLEIFWVTVDPAADTLTVVRGKGPVVGTAMNDLDPLLVVGSAHEEGSGAPLAIYYNPTTNTNYTQIFKNSYFLTKTGEQVELRTGRSKAEAKREALELHSTDMEQAFFWGAAIEDVSGAQAKRTTKGIFNFVTSNITDFNDALTVSNWQTFMELCFRAGSREKAMFTGGAAINTLGQMSQSYHQLQAAGTEKIFGIDFEKWRTSFGVLYVVNHPLFSNNSTFNDWMFVVDLKAIKYRYMEGGDTQFQDNLQTPDLDAVKAQFYTHCGLEVQIENYFGVGKNASAFAA